MNILDRIMADHAKQRTMLKQLVETDKGSDERSGSFLNIREELLRHAEAEEQCLYAPLIEIAQTPEEVQHGISDHHQINEIIEQLESTDMNSPSWLKYASVLREEVLRHLDDEEENIFPVALNYFSEDALERLGSKFDIEKS